MGDASTPFDGSTDERPRHAVNVSGFYMDRFEVTKQLWDDVRAWGLTHGYTDLPVGSYSGTTNYSKGASHPVHYVSWYAVVKWCNARSERDNLMPTYFTNDAQTVIYKTGSVNVTNAQVKWGANGYRLPTEPEWEKAARGGVTGKRFPWGDTITHSQANYRAGSSYTYDLSYPAGYHPTYAVNGNPYTSPVGSFGANGYGLYDMAGNVLEWCWDWYGSTYYSTSPGTDPQGPPPGSDHVLRGGSWGSIAINCRSAYRISRAPGYGGNGSGFRSVRR